MPNSIQHVSPATNEPILDYRPGSSEKKTFEIELQRLRSEEIDIPMIINGEEVRTDKKVRMSPPYEHDKTLGYFNRGNAEHVHAAIDAALAAKKSWAAMPWSDRAAIFLRAADLISGPRRAYISACTMLAQSKNIYQAEIDAVAELADFFRFNANYMEQIYAQQPQSSPTVWNQLEYRPLEGFIFAVTPFNFTAIAGNLPGAPAMMGNTVVWKPADSQVYSAIAVMNILNEAGLPPGVINLIFPEGPVAGDIIFKHKEFAGLHFTGSTGVFNTLWKTIGENISSYKSYPRIVGETGGKDFIMVHNSADPAQVATAMLRGAFEFQGQKCSAASRTYVPASLWPAIKEKFLRETEGLKMGTPEDFSNFVNAVIDERSFDKIASYIDRAQADADAEIICGGTYDKSKGYFVAPTAIVTKDPKYLTMCEEIFGPVLTIHVYEDDQYSEMLQTLDQTSEYALTGSIFSNDRAAVLEAREALVYSAGNFYINDKPTGAVVGQQPFGGSRASGTNDKAGSILNLYRWVSPRTIKENFVPPTDYRYPFLGE